MKERGILFSSAMVRALLSGAKTQTRRAVKPRHHWHMGERPDGAPWPFFDAYVHAEPDPVEVPCPYGAPGDRLWVRETFYCDHFEYDPRAGAEKRAEFLDMMEYRADHDCRSWEAGCPCHDENGRSSWRPSIFMPRWASRLTLDVLSVRVERLHDISEEDARAEGVSLDVGCPCQGDAEDPGEHLPLCRFSFDPWPGETPFDEPRPYARAFAALWSSINGRKSWDENPWLWVIDVRRVAGGEP